uniref:Extracellular matrix protein 1b n=1 Tax=Monopterus albus TaxID=43700 RepID=A0A3Q3Q4I2_MONAL|nr:extracellular matrix protein 1-like [Monopterus albus]
MGSSWALVCSAALALVLLGSASSEIQPPEDLMMQREVDMTDIIKDLLMQAPEDTLTERESSKPDVLTPRGRKPGFYPHSFGGPSEAYPVQFPLGRPTSDNLQAICFYRDRRPRYPDSYFPGTGFSGQMRKGSAVNNAELWFGTCCKGNQTWEREVMLCCATRAWELSIKSFCDEEFSIKTRHYHCCKQNGRDRLNCFHNNAPNPNYEPTEEIPVTPLSYTTEFNFDPNTCPRTVMTSSIVSGQKNERKPSTSQNTFNFPPGRPTTDTIEPLCHNQKLRPLYNVKCLPSSGYELLARQAKTINRLEKGFRQCCKKPDVLSCADQKWRAELDRFCLDKKSRQVDFHCCSLDEANARYSCFQHISPDPHYNMTSATEEPSVHQICDTHRIIQKKYPVGFPLKSLVNQCCPLSKEDMSICLLQELDSMCSSKRTSLSFVRRCCHGVQPTFQCASRILMDAITKATKVLNQKKMCPVS